MVFNMKSLHHLVLVSSALRYKILCIYCLHQYIAKVINGKRLFFPYQVDDDNTHYPEDYNQPGLAQDANVFLGGEPGGKYVGYSGCIESFQVFISPTKFASPDWTSALKIDFSQKTSLTILYGNYQCGVCALRDMVEERDENQVFLFGAI